MVTKWTIFWISEFDYLLSGVNILHINIAPKQDMSVWKVSFLTLDSPFKLWHLFQNMLIRNESHHGGKPALKITALIIESVIVPLLCLRAV
jgi:hypothetical protein